MSTEIDPAARLVVIPVGLGTYATAEMPGRTPFKKLTKVTTDLRKLATLFAEPRFAGCQLLRRVSGTRAQVRAKLDAIVTDLQQLEPRPAICLLWAGHAMPLQSDDLRLATKDSYQPMRSNDGLTPTELVDTLAAAGAPAVYVILDVCRAATAATDLATTAIRRMTDRPPTAGQGSPRFAFLCSAQAYEDAKDGVFGSVLVGFLRRGVSEPAQQLINQRGYGNLSPNDSLLTPRTLGSVLEVEFEVLKATNGRIQKPVSYDLNNDFAVFPNPLWTGSAQPRRMSAPADLAGVGARPVAPDNPVVEEIAAFATESAGDPAMLIIKGQPGAGTSTVLQAVRTRLRAVASEPIYARRRDVDATVDLFRHSRSEAMRDIVTSLTASGTEGPGYDQSFRETIARHQRAAGRPLTIVLDGLNYASEPHRITTEVVQDLIEGGSRVVVGAGDGLIDWSRLTDVSPQVIDLDLVAGSAIDTYLERRLATTAVSPPRQRTLLGLLSGKALGRFLYAELALDHLLAGPGRLTTSRVNALPDTVEELFDRILADLDEAFVATFGIERGASALALGLAWSAGQGVPRRSDVWGVVARAAAQLSDPLTDPHVDWFLRTAGGYVWETSEHRQAVYRLSNPSLATHLRQSDDAARVRIAAALTEVQRVGGWAGDNPYLAMALPWYLGE